MLGLVGNDAFLMYLVLRNINSRKVLVKLCMLNMKYILNYEGM